MSIYIKSKEKLGLSQIWYNLSMLELISYNIHFGETLGKIVSWIKRADPKPDVVCFQEFPENRLEELKEMLDGIYSFVFAPAFLKRKVRYGELTIFKNETLKLARSKIIELGESKIDRAVFRHKSHRSSLLTEFKYGRKTFTVANVHLVLLALHGRRKKQLATTISEVKKNQPTIIVGDYNYSILLGRKKSLLNFMKSYDFKMAGERFVTHKIWKFPQQIDYAFYKDLDVIETKVGRVKYSDHFPIAVRFKI